MSALHFIQAVKQHASISGNNVIPPKIGTVTGYDPTNYLVTVQLYQATNNFDTLQTGWIPLLSPWVGNGWGMFAPPNIGDTIEVHFQEGSVQSAFACLRTFGDQALPLNVPSGEFWLVHQTGSFVKFLTDGSVSISSSVSINVTAPSVVLGDPLLAEPLLKSDMSPTVNVTGS